MSRVWLYSSDGEVEEALRARFSARGLEVSRHDPGDEGGDAIVAEMRGSVGVIVDVSLEALVAAGGDGRGEGVSLVREIMEGAIACGVVKVVWLLSASNARGEQDGCDEETFYLPRRGGEERAEVSWVMECEVMRYVRHGVGVAHPVIGLCEEGLVSEERARGARLMLERGKPGRRYVLSSASSGAKSERSSGEIGW